MNPAKFLQLWTVRTRRGQNFQNPTQVKHAAFPEQKKVYVIDPVIGRTLLPVVPPPTEITRYITSTKEKQERQRQQDALFEVGKLVLPQPQNERLFYYESIVFVLGLLIPFHVYFMVYEHEDEKCAKYYEWLATEEGQAGLMMLAAFPSGTLFLRKQDVDKIKDMTWAETRTYVAENHEALVAHTNELLKRKTPLAESDVNTLLFGGVDCVEFSKYSLKKQGSVTTISVLATTCPGKHNLKGSVTWQYEYDSRHPNRGRCTWLGHGSSTFMRDAGNIPAARFAFAEAARRLLTEGCEWWHDRENDESFRDYLTHGTLKGNEWFRRAVVSRLLLLGQQIGSRTKPPRLMIRLAGSGDMGVPTEHTIELNESEDDDPSAVNIELPLTDDLLLESIERPSEIMNILESDLASYQIDRAKRGPSGLYIGDRAVHIEASEAIFSAPRLVWAENDAGVVANIVTRAVIKVIDDALMKDIQESISTSATRLANKPGTNVKKLCTPVQPHNFDEQLLPPDLFDVSVVLKGMIDNGVIEDAALELGDLTQTIIDAVAKDEEWIKLCQARNWDPDDNIYSLTSLVSRAVIGRATWDPNSFVMAALSYTAVQLQNMMLRNEILQIKIQQASAQDAWQKSQRSLRDAQISNKPQVEIDVKEVFKNFWKDRLDSINKAVLRNTSANRSEAERKALDEQNLARQNFPTFIKDTIVFACEDGARARKTGLTPIPAVEPTPAPATTPVIPSTPSTAPTAAPSSDPVLTSSPTPAPISTPAPAPVPSLTRTVAPTTPVSTPASAPAPTPAPALSSEPTAAPGVSIPAPIPASTTAPTTTPTAPAPLSIPAPAPATAPPTNTPANEDSRTTTALSVTIPTEAEGPPAAPTVSTPAVQTPIRTESPSKDNQSRAGSRSRRPWRP